MFRNDKLIKPSSVHMGFTALVAVLSFFGSQTYPVIGYTLAICLLLFLAAYGFLDFKIWPTYGHSVSVPLFACFWGLIIGLVIPFTISVLIEDGIAGIWALLTS